MAKAIVAEPAMVVRRRKLHLWQSLLRSRTGALGLGILVILCFCAVFAPYLAPMDPMKQALAKRLTPPFWLERGTAAHLLGTDQLGRDILSRLVYGSRISLLVGVTSVTISATFGVALGLIAGYYGGRADTLIMGLVDLQLSFPSMLLAITVVAVLGPGLENVILVLAVTRWMGYARVVRGEVLSIREKEYVEAARALGLPSMRIILRHILPNSLNPIIVIATFSVAGAIITEASLSFLGLGVEPWVPTWGTMLADGRGYLSTAWWLATFPGLAIVFTVLSINLLGDWLRDILDPRLRHER